MFVLKLSGSYKQEHFNTNNVNLILDKFIHGWSSWTQMYISEHLYKTDSLLYSPYFGINIPKIEFQAVKTNSFFFSIFFIKTLYTNIFFDT